LARSDAVLKSVTELLASGGYDSLTIAEVAAKASVGRQMIYRWWPTKRDLVADALFDHVQVQFPADYEGPLRSDLRALVTVLVKFAAQPAVQAGMPGLITDLRNSTDTPASIEDSFVGPLRASFEALCVAGRSRGEVRRNVNRPMTLDSLRGAVLGHSLYAQRDEKDVVKHLVELMFRMLST
jgi:AcrR family transcriptional regulator